MASSRQESYENRKTFDGTSEKCTFVGPKGLSSSHTTESLERLVDVLLDLLVCYVQVNGSLDKLVDILIEGGFVTLSLFLR